MRSIRHSLMALTLAGFLFTSCKKDCDMHPIVVDAGATKTVQLPADTSSLNGTVVSGITANTTYLWTLISGPNVPVFGSSTAATTSLSGLVAGTYVFQFEATNSYGMTGLDTTSIAVLPVGAPTIKTLSLKPSNNLYEGFMSSINTTYFETGDAHQLLISAWTLNGQYYALRTCIKFDYTGIPAGATVDSANLYLFSNPVPIDGDKISAQDGTANACFVQRITSSWTSPTVFTWNTPPTATTSNEAVIPQSTAPFGTDVINVSKMVSDMLVNGNNGFYISLQNESIYNARQYASSYNTDSTIRPKLVITYH